MLTLYVLKCYRNIKLWAKYEYLKLKNYSTLAHCPTCYSRVNEEIYAGMDFYKKQFLKNFTADSVLLPSDCQYKVIHIGNDNQMKHTVEN